MRFLWSIHMYPPAHNCGAEYVAHNVNKYLLSKGHEVRVFIHEAPKKACYKFDGVQVFQNITGLGPYTWADVMITHLDYTKYSMSLAQLVRKPIIHFMHNTEVEAYRCIEQAPVPQFMVYNSDWAKDTYGFKADSMVLYPPCPARAYRLADHDPGKAKYITLINCNENKGGFIFYRLAAMMPERQFLAIKGSYDCTGLQPEILALLAALPNVTIKDHSPDVLSVYRDTRLLLVPSRYESWGRVATEAMLNGIPVLAAPTPGLKENLGAKGLFLPQRGLFKLKGESGKPEHDADTYPFDAAAEQIRKLDDPEEYIAASIESFERGQQLDLIYNYQMYEFEQFAEKAKQQYHAFCKGAYE